MQWNPEWNRGGQFGKEPPRIVAELSGNHDGSLAKALETIDAVAESGADAVKLQTYTPATITLNVDSDHFRIGKSHSLWGGERLFDLYERAHTPWEWHEELFERARSQNLEIFSTPFDSTAVDFLEDLQNPIYKIASIEIIHLPLIERAARTGKPLIISTGTANLAEIESAVQTARAAGSVDLMLLVCSSSYPADPKDTNLARMEVLRRAFGVPVGLSDHTQGIGVSIAAIALGASLVEKHVTLEKSEGGADSEFSITTGELAQLVTESKRAFQAIGAGEVWFSKSEETSLSLRPSIHVSADVRKGDAVSLDNVKIARPAGGLQPKHYQSIIGRTFSRDLPLGQPLNWAHLV
jgi:pseudaminic acid synthase